MLIKILSINYAILKFEDLWSGTLVLIMVSSIVLTTMPKVAR